jgi:hypothetical protein
MAEATRKPPRRTLPEGHAVCSLNAGLPAKHKDCSYHEALRRLRKGTTLSVYLSAGGGGAEIFSTVYRYTERATCW